MTVLSQRWRIAASHWLKRKTETFVPIYVENSMDSRCLCGFYAILRVILRFPKIDITPKPIERWAYDWPLFRVFMGVGGWG